MRGGRAFRRAGQLFGAGPDVPEPAETVPPQGGRVLRAQAVDEMGLCQDDTSLSFPVGGS